MKQSLSCQLGGKVSITTLDLKADFLPATSPTVLQGLEGVHRCLIQFGKSQELRARELAILLETIALALCRAADRSTAYTPLRQAAKLASCDGQKDGRSNRPFGRMASQPEDSPVPARLHCLPFICFKRELSSGLMPGQEPLLQGFHKSCSWNFSPGHIP